MSLKRPVTIAQARQWPAAAARRKSFCARMGGMRDKLTSDRVAMDPRSKINRALAAWDCDVPELLDRKHVKKGIRPMKITSKMVGAEARKARKNPAFERGEGAALSGETIKRMMRQARVTIPQLASRMGITQARVRMVRERGVSGGNYVRDWVQGITGNDPGPIHNPARKPVAKAAKPRANPAAPARQKMRAIVRIDPKTGLGIGVERVPIDFDFRAYIGGVQYDFFARTEGAQLIVSERTTGAKVGAVPYTTRAAALNDREAAKLYLSSVVEKVGADKFKAAVAKAPKLTV